jgi:hypothetical protein
VDGAMTLEKERAQAKKMMRIGIIAAFSGGIGLAIFLMQMLFSGMSPSDDMNILINGTCLILMSYTGIVTALYLFRRDWLLSANPFLLYVLIPGALLKLYMSYL